MSEAKPSGHFLWQTVNMARTAILIDGGYLLKRLPDVRPDVDRHGAGAVAVAVLQLANNHLKQLNEHPSHPVETLKVRLIPKASYQLEDASQTIAGSCPDHSDLVASESCWCQSRTIPGAKREFASPRYSPACVIEQVTEAKRRESKVALPCTCGVA